MLLCKQLPLLLFLLHLSLILIVHVLTVVDCQLQFANIDPCLAFQSFCQYLNFNLI